MGLILVTDPLEKSMLFFGVRIDGYHTQPSTALTEMEGSGCFHLKLIG